jgi:hypothetical protein
VIAFRFIARSPLLHRRKTKIANRR